MLRAMTVFLALGGIFELSEGSARALDMEEKAMIPDTVINGVQRLAWGAGRECTAFGALQAALVRIGEPLDYAWLMGVSGAAFRLNFAYPTWDWSSVDGLLGYDHGGAAFKALGYSYEITCQDEVEARKKIDASLARGVPVPGIDLAVAAEWGVIAGVAGDGKSYLCRTYFDKGDELTRTERWPWLAMIIGEKKQQPSPKENLLEALRIAAVISYHHGFQSLGGCAYASGFNAWETWIKELESSERFVSLDDAGLRKHGSINRFIYTSLMDARDAAVAFLKGQTGVLEGESRARLEQAAGLYEQIAARLHSGDLDVPCAETGRGWPWTPEQRAKQAAILRDCLGLEREAIGLFKGILALEGQPLMSVAPVAHAAGKGAILGVPALGWGKERECTFAGALESATVVTEYPATYMDIMGWTGLAFRTRWFVGAPGKPDRWCPSSPVGEFPEECSAAEQATGWRFRGEVHLGEPEPHMEAYVLDIRKSLDAGLPVLAYDEKFNMALLTGYADEGQSVVMRDYFNGERTIPVGHIGPILMFLQSHGPALSPRDAFLTALKIAVGNWNRPEVPADAKGAYHYGVNALEHWRADISLYDSLTPEERASLFFVSWWCYSSLVDARQQAAPFLRAHAGLFREAARVKLEEAAVLYEREVALLMERMHSGDVFLGPWTGKTMDDWTPESRRKESELLGEARGLEEQAVTALREALREENVKIIPNVGVLDRPGVSSSSSVPQALVVALKTGGDVEVTYEHLMGASGLAFRAQLAESWCPSAGHISVGFDCASYLYEICGRELTWFQADDLEGRHRAIKDSIDRGWPVLHSWEECSLLIGYENDGQRFLRRGPAYYGPDKWLSDADWDWAGAGVLGEKRDIPEELLRVRPLELAIEMAESNRDGCVIGFAAYEFWRDHLRDETWVSAIEPGGLRGLLLGNWWCYSQLVNARACAAPYLREIRPSFEGEAGRRLDEAIALYEEIATVLAEPFPLIPEPSSCAFAAPSEWTPAMRLPQADALDKALTLERKAIDALKAVLGKPAAVSSEPTTVSLESPSIMSEIEWEEIAPPLDSEESSPPEPRIVSLDAFKAAGVRWKPGEHVNIPAVWDDCLLPRMKELVNRGDSAWGISRGIPNEEPTCFDYLASWEVTSHDAIPAGMEGWEIPAMTYAVLPANDVPDLDRVITYFHEQWAPASKEWESAGGYMMERYPESYPEDHIIYLHFPVKPRKAALQEESGRLALEGVPKVGYFKRVCPFPGSLESVMEYLGDPCDFDYVMAVSGAAFRRMWEKDDGGNVDLMYFAPEPYQRAFTALGRTWRGVSADDRAAMLGAIKTSLARNVPVLAMGVVGPPECGIVTGYSQGGDALHGWSYFQDAALPGYYEKTNWYEDSTWVKPHAVLMPGARIPRPAERDILISTLRHAIELARIAVYPHHPQHANGLSAYDAWANGLERDADYPAGDAEVMARRIMVHGDQTCMLYDRHSVPKYLSKMADQFPEVAESLRAAADLYKQVTDEGSFVWPWGCDMADPAIARDLADDDKRRENARHVRIARDKEALAVDMLEKVLEVLSPAEAAAARAAIAAANATCPAPISAPSTVVESTPMPAPEPAPEPAPAPEVISTTAKEVSQEIVQPSAPVEKILEGVPYVGFDFSRLNSPEDFCLPSCMRAVMRFLGDDPALDYFHFLGVSGLAFSTPWHKSEWRHPNEFILDPNPLKPLKRVMWAAGFNYELIGNPDACQRYGLPAALCAQQADEQTFRLRVKESIDAGTPVLAYGVIGPPEMCVISGYEEDGAVLTGWNGFQAEKNVFPEQDFTPEGQFRKRNWFQDTCAIVILGERLPRPSMGELDRSTLIWAVQLARQPENGDWHSGHKALDAWASAVLNDVDPADMDAVRRRHEAHHTFTGSLAEARAFASAYLDRIADREPYAASELRGAGFGGYSLIHEMMWQIWRAVEVGGAAYVMNPECAELFAEEDRRREIASIIRLAAVKDREAVAHIEKALRLMGVEDVLPEPIPADDSDPAWRDYFVSWMGDGLAPFAGKTGCGGLTGLAPDGSIPPMNPDADSFATALCEATAALPRPLNYTEVMGYSARAFGMPVMAERNPAPSRASLAALSSAVGWRLESVDSTNDPDERRRAATNAIVSLNMGVPVLIGCDGDSGIAYAYQIHRYDFTIVAPSAIPGTRLPQGDSRLQGPWIFLADQTSPIAEEEACREALRIAADNQQWSGDASIPNNADVLELWAQALETSEGAPADEQNSQFTINRRALMRLLDARQAAIAFLTMHKTALGGEHIQPAIYLYQAECETIQAFLSANPGLRAGDITVWTNDLRDAWIGLLRMCKEIEKQIAPVLSGR